MKSGGDVRIELKVFATLRKLCPPLSKLQVAAGTKVAELLGIVAVPEEKAAIIFINGRHAELESVPADGDVVSIFPPVGGG